MVEPVFAFVQDWFSGRTVASQATGASSILASCTIIKDKGISPNTQPNDYTTGVLLVSLIRFAHNETKSLARSQTRGLAAADDVRPSPCRSRTFFFGGGGFFE